MTRSISLGGIAKAAGKAISKATKPRPAKSTKAATKAAKAIVKAAPKADNLGASYAVPQSGSQADYRSAVVAAFRSIGGAAKSLADLRVSADKLKAACSVKLDMATKHGSVVVLDGVARFTDRGLLKYAAFDKRRK